MKRFSHWPLAAVPVTAAFLSLLGLAQALWIPAKAELAQWLIDRSWNQVLAGQPNAQPWPWADTQPLGVLSIPEQGVRQVVLQGNSGRNLAFGPVLLDGSAMGTDLVISGHRDTHFRFLQDLKAGDRVQLELRDAIHVYEVHQIEIVDSRRQDLVVEPGARRLSLVTCYPFDTAVAGGPLRYVVTALPVALDFRIPRYSLSSG